MSRVVATLVAITFVACGSGESGGGAPGIDGGTGGLAAATGTGGRAASGSGGKSSAGTGGATGAADGGAGGAPEAGSGGVSAGGSGTDAGSEAAAGGSGGASEAGAGGAGGAVDTSIRFQGLDPESAIVADGQTIHYVATLASPAPAGGLLVSVDIRPSGGSLSVDAPSSLLVPEGETTVSFDVTVTGVGAAAIRLSNGSRVRHAWVAVTSDVDHLVISEAYYHPPPPVDGNQFVELYNGGSSPVDLTTYSLQVAGSAYTLLVPFGPFVLPPGACAVLDGLGGLPLSGTADPAAHAIALFDGTTIVDAVLYGGPNSNDLPDETGTPGTLDSPSGAFTGLSLQRVGPTAWWTSTPTPGDCSLIGGQAPVGPDAGGADAALDASPDASDAGAVVPDAAVADASADGG